MWGPELRVSVEGFGFRRVHCTHHIVHIATHHIVHIARLWKSVPQRGVCVYVRACVHTCVCVCVRVLYVRVCGVLSLSLSKSLISLSLLHLSLHLSLSLLSLCCLAHRTQLLYE